MKILGVNISRDQEQVPRAKRTGRPPSWGELIGQTLLLFFFLLLGAGVARLGAYYASPPVTSRVGGKLIEYRNLEFAGNAIIKREDVKGFSQLSVLTRITEPQNALASMVIYGLKDNGLTTELQRIDQVSSTWTSCDQQISYSAIVIRMEAQSVSNANSQTQTTLERGGEELKEAASPKKTPAGKGKSPEKINRGQKDVAKLKENPPPTEKIDLLIFLHPN